MELKGKIKKIDETKSYGTSNFRKRELVLETQEQYPQTILLSFQQDKCDVLNNYKVGDVVTIGINIRGKEYVNQQSEVKYFNELIGWKITKETQSNNPNDTQREPHQSEKISQVSESENTGLPF
jgi:hypothetical protein